MTGEFASKLAPTGGGVLGGLELEGDVEGQVGDYI
jgi:hypothetical protein